MGRFKLAYIRLDRDGWFTFVAGSAALEAANFFRHGSGIGYVLGPVVSFAVFGTLNAVDRLVKQRQERREASGASSRKGIFSGS
jgi:hypothetical protein